MSEWVRVSYLFLSFNHAFSFFIFRFHSDSMTSSIFFLFEPAICMTLIFQSQHVLPFQWPGMNESAMVGMPPTVPVLEEPAALTPDGLADQVHQICSSNKVGLQICTHYEMVPLSKQSYSKILKPGIKTIIHHFPCL